MSLRQRDLSSWFPYLVGAVGCGVSIYTLVNLLRELKALRQRVARLENDNAKERRRPCKLVLLRHGESAGNVNVEIYETVPDSEIQLTEKGVQQAQICGHKLQEIVGDRDLFVYVSPFARAKRTWEEIAKAFPSSQVVHYREDPFLREQEFTGRTIQDKECEIHKKERKKFSSFYYRVGSGESGADVYSRVTLFLDTIYRDFRVNKKFHDECCVVIVAHGVTNKMLLTRWLRWPVEKYVQANTPGNCDILIAERQLSACGNQMRFEPTQETLKILKLPEEVEPSAGPWSRVAPHPETIKRHVQSNKEGATDQIRIASRESLG